MEFGATAKFKLSELDPRQLEALRTELFLKQKSGKSYGYGEGKAVHLFKEVADTVAFPRQYALRQILTKNHEVKDATVEGEAISFNFTRDLRDNQVPMVRTFLDELSRSDNRYGGIFSAPCGTGKTIMTLKFLASLGRTAIILVHNTALVKQWKEALLGNPDAKPEPKMAFTDLLPSDVGIIQQEDCDWQGKKVVIAMVESLISRAYPPEMYRYFGVVVLDEVHRHGAVEWHQAMNYFPARVRIGLSATPRRGDGLWNVIRWNVGDVLFKGEGGGKAKVFIVPTGLPVHPSLYSEQQPDGSFSDDIDLPRLTSVLVKNPYRNNLIISHIVSAMEAGRRPLILSARREHLEVLREGFTEIWKKKVPLEERTSNALMGSKPLLGVQIGYYVGGMKDKDIEYSRTCNLLFGTYAFAKEGLDDPGMDTLFLASPTGDVEQAAGRILRALEGKRTPFITDFLDEKVKPCVKFGHNRSRQYKALGFDVTEIVPQEGEKTNVANNTP